MDPVVSGPCYSFEWRMGNVYKPSMYSKKSNYSLQGLFHDKYDLQLKTPAKTAKDYLLNAKLIKLSLREKTFH